MNIKFTPNSVVAAAGAGFACSWAAHGGTTAMSAPHNSSSSCSRVVWETSNTWPQTSLEALRFQPAARSGLSWADHAPGMNTLGKYGRQWTRYQSWVISKGISADHSSVGDRTDAHQSEGGAFECIVWRRWEPFAKTESKGWFSAGHRTNWPIWSIDSEGLPSLCTQMLAPPHPLHQCSRTRSSWRSTSRLLEAEISARELVLSQNLQSSPIDLWRWFCWPAWCVVLAVQIVFFPTMSAHPRRQQTHYAVISSHSRVHRSWWDQDMQNTHRSEHFRSVDKTPSTAQAWEAHKSNGY